MYEKGIVSETCESNTPSFRIIISNLPFSTLSQLAKPPSLTPYVKAKKKILLTTPSPSQVITMTKSNRAVDNVPGSTKRSRAFRVSIE